MSSGQALLAFSIFAVLMALAFLWAVAHNMSRHMRPPVGDENRTGSNNPDKNKEVIVIFIVLIAGLFVLAMIAAGLAAAGAP